MAYFLFFFNVVIFQNLGSHPTDGTDGNLATRVL
jgi:hypothetical protein